MGSEHTHIHAQKTRPTPDSRIILDSSVVGTNLFSNCTACGTGNDFTADIVRVYVNGEWRDMAKTGRRACGNPEMARV